MAAIEHAVEIAKIQRDKCAKTTADNDCFAQAMLNKSRGQRFQCLRRCTITIGYHEDVAILGGVSRVSEDIFHMLHCFRFVGLVTHQHNSRITAGVKHQAPLRNTITC